MMTTLVNTPAIAKEIKKIHVSVEVDEDIYYLPSDGGDPMKSRIPSAIKQIYMYDVRFGALEF